MKKKKGLKKPNNTIIAAIITGMFVLLAAIVTGLFNSKVADISNNNKDVKEPPIISQLHETIEKELDVSIYPDPEKPLPPQEVYDHNKNVKMLLDKLIRIPDKENKKSLDIIFAEIEISLKIYPEYGETHYFYAIAFSKRGDYYHSRNESDFAINEYYKSIDEYNKAEENNYNHPTNIFYDRGIVYASLGSAFEISDLKKFELNYRKSIEDFSHALDAGYKYPENVNFALGNSYCKLGEHEIAANYYSDALKTANDKYPPTRETILIRRSDAYFLLGDKYFYNDKKYDEAIEKYTFAIKDNPANYGAYNNRGNAYCHLKLWAVAIDDYDFILEKNPPNFDIRTVRESRRFARSML
jgi:tetratricopeptide (TPR) repeat protein